MFGLFSSSFVLVCLQRWVWATFYTLFQVSNVGTCCGAFFGLPEVGLCGECMGLPRVRESSRLCCVWSYLYWGWLCLCLAACVVRVYEGTQLWGVCVCCFVCVSLCLCLG